MNSHTSHAHQPLAALLLAVLPCVLAAQQPGWTWTQVALTGMTPAARLAAAMSYDSQRSRTVMFGGGNGSDFSDTWEWDGTVWTQSNPATWPPARAAHTMAYDSQRGLTVMFGGLSGSLLGDTWEWNGTNWMPASTSGPGGRCGPSMSYDVQRGLTVLFGGQGTGPVLGDSQVWNGTAWTQVSTSGPSSRFSHMMAYDSLRGRTVLFGGHDGSSSHLGDTWEWDGTTWAMMSTSGPAARRNHAMVYDSQQGRTVLFGGIGGSNFGDTWEWNGTIWTQLNIQGPGVRYQHAMAYDSQRGRTVLYGGYNTSLLGETWELTGPPVGPTAPITFTSLPTTATPPAVTGHALASLPGGGQVLFGGSTSTNFPILTYELHGGSWAKQFSLLNPMVRHDHSLMLDPVRQNNLLFGGRNPLGTALNDTWTWASGAWTYLPLANRPSPRAEHRMAFDRSANTGLLFGGRDNNNIAFGDFWSWNGTGWNQLNPTALPPARFAHGLAFDTHRSRLVLYGGADASGPRDDVWEWNGTQWAQITPNAGPVGPWTPGARSGFGMAYDPRSERVVVHGGDAGGCMGDVWSWDGAAWTLHIQTGTAPSPRGGEQLLHDATTNQLLLFAGGCGASMTDDLWNLDLPVFWRWSPFGTGCVGSNGVPALSVTPGSTAILGQTLQLQLTNVPAFFSTSFGMLGYSRTTFLGQPIPYSLSVFGLPGCLTWTSADGSYPMTLPNAQGLAIWALPLPNASFLLGFELNLQTLSFEAPGFGRWASVSNGLIVRCGDR